jgi:hypothetical protein
VTHTILFQRITISISLNSANPMWSLQLPPVSLLLKDPQDDKTACGHLLGPGDTMEDSYVGGESIECATYMNEVSKS